MWQFFAATAKPGEQQQKNSIEVNEVDAFWV